VTAPPKRSAPAQGGPPASLKGIPTSRVPGTHWYREHGHRPSAFDGGCWYYASLPADPATGGRFDVPAPDGTCYFANRSPVAALERIGRFTAQHKPVPADLVDGRVISTIEATSLPDRAVNLVGKRAATHFGVTGELFTMSDYAVPQAWADAIHQSGHSALVYTPRFSPQGRAIAAFGGQGPQPKPTTGTQPLMDVLEGEGIAVVGIPPASALPFVKPPTAATGP
jgi:hypothetical protein